MSFLDKIASAVMPPESDEDRLTARRNAESMATPGEWLEAVLEHHRQIEAAFSRALTGGDAASRRAGVKELGVLLTGHSNAEESVIYPALAEIGEKADAGTAYEEQAMAKIQMAMLETLDPMSEDWREKLQHIRGAVQHHVYHEEKDWFPTLQRQLPESRQTVLTRRYLEEFTRYAGEGRPDMPSQMAAQIP